MAIAVRDNLINKEGHTYSHRLRFAYSTHEDKYFSNLDQKKAFDFSLNFNIIEPFYINIQGRGVYKVTIISVQ